MRMRSVPMAVLVLPAVKNATTVAADCPLNPPPSAATLSVLFTSAPVYVKFKLPVVNGGRATLLVFVVAVVLVVRPSSAPRIVVLPEMSRDAFGLAFKMPTLPLAEMSIELVGAPGLMRKGRREPLVTSR